MKVKWLGKTVSLELTHNKVYEVLSIEKGWYRVTLCVRIVVSEA